MHNGDIIAERFVIEAPVGQGGMGIVFRARDRDGGLVALKVLKHLHPAALQRFTREAEVLAALALPGIVRYVAHGQGPTGSPFLAMQWLDGEDLAERLTRGPLAVDEAMALACRVASTLGAAHALGVVHRDIKPHNLFLPGGSLEDVTLVDFGIARHGAASSELTATGALLGTAGYLAPEQATRGARGLDASADVFSLGCVLFECLAGKPPFAGENALAVLSKILLAEAPRVRDLRPEVPAWLDALITEMLAKDPAARPPDGAAVAGRLDAPRELGPDPSIPLRALRRALTQGEQQLLSVVLLRPADGSGAPLTEPSGAGAGSSTIEREVARFDGRHHLLLDGSSLVTLSGLGVATDLAAQAARCALRLRTLDPASAIALATGRAEANVGLPVGEVIDRAVSLVRASASASEAASAKGASPCSGIRVDEVTAGLLDHRFELGGDARAIELVRERALSEPRTFLGKILPCVGRERELAGLEAIASECAAERSAAVVLVTAPPGVGKSRLRHELLARLATRDPSFEIMMAAAEPLRAGSALGLVAEALRYTAGIRGPEPSELRHKKLRARLSRNIAMGLLHQVSDFLGELVGAPPPEGPSVALQAARRDPQLMGAQLQRAFEAFLEAELARGPVLFVLEDLQWADPATVRFLDAALHTFSGESLMVLALARPEVRAAFPELWASHGVIEIGLGTLPGKAMERFIQQALGDAIDTARARRIAERSQGNAFYLEELCRAAAEGRDATLPDTIVAMASARLEAFAPEDRRLLRAASVFGERFWLGGVQAMGEGDRGTLRARLHALAEREVVTRCAEARFPGEEEYIFRHALMREAAYAALTEEDRRLGHRLAAEWLADGREHDPLVLAEHFERGGDADRAIREYVRAARQTLAATALAAPETLRALSGRALALGAAGEARGELLAIEIEADVWAGRMNTISDRGREALRLLSRTSALWYRTAGWVVTVARIAPELEPADRDLLDELFDEPLRPELVTAQLFNWGMLLLQVMLLGHYPDARRLQRRIEEAERFVNDVGVAAAQPQLDPHILGGVALSKAFIAYQMDGDPWLMRRMCLEAREHYRLAEELNLIRNIEMHIAVAELMLGAHAEAEAGLRALGTDAPDGPLVAVFLGITLYWAGRHAEARALLTSFMPVTLASQSAVDIAVNRALLAHILLAQGHLEAAEEETLLALEFQGAGFRSFALSALTELRLLQGRIDEAVAATRERERIMAEAGIVDVIGLVKLSTYVTALDAAGIHIDDRLSELRALILDRAARVDDPRFRQAFLAAPDNALLLRLAEERLGPTEPGHTSTLYSARDLS